MTLLSERCSVLRFQDNFGVPLFVVDLSKDHQKSWLIAYEGKGAYVYEFGEPLNKWRLVSAGFDLFDAEVVMNLLEKGPSLLWKTE